MLDPDEIVEGNVVTDRDGTAFVVASVNRACGRNRTCDLLTFFGRTVDGDEFISTSFPTKVAESLEEYERRA